MAGNSFTIVTNDTRAARVTGMARREMQEVQAGAGVDDKIVEDEKGFVGSFGRGASDPLITYLALARNNTKVYIYVNDLLNAVVVSTVKP